MDLYQSIVFWVRTPVIFHKYMSIPTQGMALLLGLILCVFYSHIRYSLFNVLVIASTGSLSSLADLLTGTLYLLCFLVVFPCVILDQPFVRK